MIEDITKATITEATGIKIGQYGHIHDVRLQAKQTFLLHWSWTIVPWWVRLLGVVRLPYDVIRFVVTGEFIFVPWPWIW